MTRLRQVSTSKIDLLFMIDNSSSMADKQEMLAEAVPVMLERLVSPRCLDEDGQPTGEVASSEGSCANGFPEFEPVQDIHIGVITSSLGHHGSYDVCSDATGGRTPDDRAELIGSVRSGIPSNADGFLDWQPGDATGQLTSDFAKQIQSAGELGCGYESSLEAWYRFLVDPEPVAWMDSGMTTGVNVRGDVNQTVLAQRAAFLRPDSLLAIVMLTDENDCSINDENGTQGWLVGYKGGAAVNNWRMPAATESCTADPNSECCRPCIVAAPEGCPDNAAEGCPETGSLSLAEDSMNQRCFNQTKRFGIDLLYPTSRYSDALKNPLIDPRHNGSLVPNPLFAPSGELPGRARDMVYIAGIVGVPWQDIATEDSLSDARKLEYMTARELTEQSRWDVILGNPRNNVLPTDPLMIESIDPRPSGARHPFLDNVVIIPPAPSAPMNPINGHELVVDPSTRDTLQYACIFPLREPVRCTAENAAGCDCNADEYIQQSPLCEFPEGEADGIQTYAKAFPGLRHLEVLKNAGDQSLVASICPKNTAPEGDAVSDPDYGYNPAVNGIIDRLKQGIAPNCLTEALEVEITESGEQIVCPVVEARLTGDCECDADRGRLPVPAGSDTESAVLAQLRADGQCEGTGCEQFCLCEIQELAGEALETCFSDATTAGSEFGFCYVDLENEEANPAILRSCPDDAKRMLRFAGGTAPAPGTLTFLACEE